MITTELETKASYEEVELHGHTVGYQQLGEGPLLVLLHGITSNSDCWREVIPRLAERYTVVAPDMLGHGLLGEAARATTRSGAYAAGLRDLLAVLDFDRGTVVGHSLGGGIAMQFAYLFPEHVERMALVCSGGLGKEVHPLLRAATLPGSEWVFPLMAREWTVNAGDAVRKVAARLGVEPGPDLAEFARGYASLVDQGARDAFLDTVRGVIGPDGQKVSAPRPPLPRRPDPDPLHLGHRRPDHPRRARAQRARDRPPLPPGRDRGLGPLADARRAEPRHRRAHLLHRGDEAVRVQRREGAQAPEARTAIIVGPMLSRLSRL